jgi:hypothetical protein
MREKNNTFIAYINIGAVISKCSWVEPLLNRITNKNIIIQINGSAYIVFTWIIFSKE